MADSTLSQQLGQWKTRLDTVTSNLMDLYGAESTKLIRARLKDPAKGFTGITQAKAARAIETLDDLVDLYTRLTRVIDDATELVKKGGVLRGNANEEKARELLNGPSIVLHTQHLQVRNRGLLDEGNREVRATPAEALARMEQSFAEARDALTAIADAMDHVRPRITILTQEMAALDHLARTLVMARPTALADVALPLARVESDPLGSANELGALERAVTQWRGEVRAVEADHRALLASLAQGKAALAELRDLIVRTGAAFAEARAKLADTEGLAPPPPDGDAFVASLETWLKTLEQHAAAGRFAAVKVGMAKWQQACDDRLNVERASYARNQAGLDERIELRGRYRALCAKADALRSRGLALNETAEAAVRQGRAVLDAIPFDLRAGRRLVESFEAALAAAQK